MGRLLRGEKLEPLRPAEAEAEPAAKGEETQAARQGEPTRLDPLSSPTPRPAGA
jgi:hypothetical protein